MISNILIRHYVREKQFLLETHQVTETQRKQLLSEIRFATKNIKENCYSVYELERVSSQELFDGYLSALSKQKDLIFKLRQKLEDRARGVMQRTVLSVGENLSGRREIPVQILCKRKTEVCVQLAA